MVLFLRSIIPDWQVENKRTKGPDALGKFLFILRKNLSPVRWDKCARGFLDLPNFVKAYQISETPSSYLRAGQIFVRCENRTDFTICTTWSKEKVFKCAHDLAETNFVEIFGRTKQILSVQCVRTLRSWAHKSERVFVHFTVTNVCVWLGKICFG